MKIQLTPYHRTNLSSMRIVAFLVLVALIGVPLFSSSSASSSNNKLDVAASSPTAASASNRMLSDRVTTRISEPVFKSNFPVPSTLALLLPPTSEGIETFAFPSCTVLKDSFDLGETVCAKITGAPLGTVDRAVARIAWVSPYGSLTQGADITTDPQTGSYAIPLTATQDFTDEGGSTVTVDNRGKWKIYILSAADGSVRTGTSFTVHDPAKAFVDLSISQGTTIGESSVSEG